MRLKIPIFFAFISLNLCGFSQTDTIRVDLDQMSINFKTCECILFGGCRKYAYPIRSNWKNADNLLIGNKDTIYFVIEENGTTKLEGYKQPEGEVFGKIKFYNTKSIITKIEIWEPVFLIMENNEASWSDGNYWAKQMIYKNNVLIKESSRSIIYDEKKGFARKTEVSYYKNGKSSRTKIKIQYF